MIFNKLDKLKNENPDKKDISDKGILIFEVTSEVIQAEILLKNAGIPVRVMGPPPDIQSGCDMVLEIPLNQEMAVHRLLRRSGIEPVEYLPVDGDLLKPVNLFKTTDLGEYIMVRAANMKLTVNKHTHMIVNISGGGCPDVPYLAQLMVGETLEESPQPIEEGATLCGYSLQMALEEICRILNVPCDQTTTAGVKQH